MSHYDYDNTPPTAEERKAYEERKERERQEAINATKRGYAEARRLLLSEEIGTLSTLEFMREFSKRARLSDWSATQHITFDLENREYKKSTDGRYQIIPTNVQEPDPEYLSDFQLNFIPEGTQDNEALRYKNRSELNDERATLTQNYIQELLNSGSTIFVRHADGTEEEIDFIVDPVERR